MQGMYFAVTSKVSSLDFVCFIQNMSQNTHLLHAIIPVAASNTQQSTENEWGTQSHRWRIVLLLL
jgi:hypothetical protein